MATVVYHVENSVSEFTTTCSAKLSAKSDEGDPRVVALADGGFAVAFEWAKLPQPDDQTIVIDIYNADGSPRFGDKSVLIDTAVAGSTTVDPAMTQLSDGRILVTWTDSDDAGIHFGLIDPATGDKLVGDKLMPGTDGADMASDVIALAGGGWALVKQDDVSETDQDADIFIYSAAGAKLAETALYSNSSSDEQAPAAAVLTAGPYAGHVVVAYQKETFNDTDEFSVVVEMFTATGQRVMGPVTIDGAGQNLRPDVVALHDGGFAVAYEDDTWGSPGASVAVFDAGGTMRGILRVDSDALVDRELSIGVLANGFIVVTRTEVSDAGDIRCEVFDPATLARVLTLGTIEAQALLQDESSLAVLADGRIVTAWTDANSTIADGNTDPGDRHVSIQIDSIVRTTTGGDAGETLEGDALVDRIHGNLGDDTLRGFGGNDFLHGGIGSDTLDGGTGFDTMEGGADSDVYFVDALGDIVIEKAGGGAADWVKASVTYDLLAGVHVEKLSTVNAAATTAINLYGNEIAQEITGNAGANLISDGGRGGADTLVGLGGNDTYRVYNAGAIIVETATQGTSDTVQAAVSYILTAGAHVETMRTIDTAATTAISLYGNEFGQTITGNAGANALRGYAGDDVINGGAGADKISGGLGNDTLAGNTGADTYYFSYALNGTTNVDTIKGFSGIDLISLSAAIFTKAGPAGVLAASAFVANENGTAAGAADRIIYETDSGILRYDPDGTGSASATAFAKMDGLPAMNNADFIIA